MALTKVSGSIIRDGITISGIVTATSFVGALSGTASSTTNIPNLTGAITSNNTTTSLGSFTSAQLATALTDETGSGSAVFATSPVLTTPSLGIATATSLNVTGIVTATSFSGSGANLTGIISGVGIQSAGTLVGSGITTLNFTGAGTTFSVSGNTATITVTGNSAPVTKISTATFTPSGNFTETTGAVSTTSTTSYTITGLSPYQVVTFDITSTGGTTTSPAVQCGAAGTASGTISFAAGATAYPSGALQTIRFISAGETITKTWNVILPSGPGSGDALGWNSTTDTYAWYTYGTSTQTYVLSGYEGSINLDVQSRMRRCVINASGVVQYYLDADDSTKKSGDWLRIVERNTISVDYTGTHSETTSTSLRTGISAWSAGTYSLGNRVTYGGYLWECVAATTTATPAVGSVSSVLTGGDGMVMVQIPAFGVRHTVSGTVHTFQVALGTSNSGYTVHPAFVKADTTYKPYIYIGAYQATGASTSGGMTSVSGSSNIVSATRATFRTAASGRGTGWHQHSHYEYAAVQLLLVTEFQSVNIQKKLGNGAQEGSVYVVNTGLSNARGNRCGNAYTSGGNAADYISYRGLENFYGRAWQFTDGININTLDIYMTQLWTNFADDTSTNYSLIGTITSGSGSYITNFLNLNNVLLPSAASGGSATSYVGDGLWTSSGWRVSIVGGGTGGGSLGGPFCFAFTHASSAAAASVGSRLAWSLV